MPRPARKERSPRQMTERNPRRSLNEGKKQGGNEERSKLFVFFEHSVSSPPPLPVISLPVVIDDARSAI